MDERVPAYRDAPASSSRETASGSREEKWCRVSTVLIVTSRKTEIATSARELQDYKGSLQKTHWRCHTSSRKMLVTCLLQITHVLSEGCESRNNHRYAARGTRIGNSIDSIIPVQNKNFSGNPEKSLHEVSWSPTRKTKSHSH